MWSSNQKMPKPIDHWHCMGTVDRGLWRDKRRVEDFDDTNSNEPPAAAAAVAVAPFLQSFPRRSSPSPGGVDCVFCFFFLVVFVARGLTGWPPSDRHLTDLGLRWASAAGEDARRGKGALAECTAVSVRAAAKVLEVVGDQAHRLPPFDH